MRELFNEIGLVGYFYDELLEEVESRGSILNLDPRYAELSAMRQLLCYLNDVISFKRFHKFVVSNKEASPSVILERNRTFGPDGKTLFVVGKDLLLRSLGVIILEESAPVMT